MSRLISVALERRYEAAQTRVSEIVRRDTISDTGRVAYLRDLIAARNELADIYREATTLPTIGARLLWSALFDAYLYACERRDVAKRELALLESQDGAS